MHQNNEILHIFLFPHLCDAQMPNSEINAVFQGAAIGPHAILGCLRVPWFNTGVNGENLDYLTNQTIFDRFLVHGPREELIPLCIKIDLHRTSTGPHDQLSWPCIIPTIQSNLNRRLELCLQSPNFNFAYQFIVNNREISLHIAQSWMMLNL